MDRIDREHGVEDDIAHQVVPGAIAVIARVIDRVGLLVGYSCYRAALSSGAANLVQPVLLVGLALGWLFAALSARRP